MLKEIQFTFVVLIYFFATILIPTVSSVLNGTEGNTSIADIIPNDRQVNESTKLTISFPVIVRDCAEVLTYLPNAKSDIYTIHPIPGKPTEVYCNMDYDKGGWTVIQRRGEPLQTPNEARPNFFRGWADYEKGFGDVRKDYWLGLTNIAALTRIEDSELLVELVDWTGDTRTAKYKAFQVANSAEDYRLTVKGYIGTGGDSFVGHSGMKFSTKDRDQDIWTNNCAEEFKGGWWYSSCHSSNLNGLYAAEGSNGTTVDYAVGIVWNTWKGYYYSLKQVRMSIRSISLG